MAGDWWSLAGGSPGASSEPGEKLVILAEATAYRNAPNIIMKFHLSTTTANVVTGFGAGWLRVGTEEFRENVILTPDSVETGWAGSGFAALEESDFAELLASKPEMVIL